MRAAVVGTGFGCITHVRALRAAGFDVVALVGRDPDRTAERARRHGVDRSFTRLEDALEIDGLDAVTIATPPHTHAGLALAAVGAGKHVVCEKPFARDAAEARRVRDAAHGAGVVHLLGSEFRFAPTQALLTRAVAEGLVGVPRLALFSLLVPLLADPSAEVPGWWSSAAEGGGWLGAHATHVVDQIRDTLGEFDSVSASLAEVADHGWTAEDSYLVHFRLRSGADGVMTSTASDRGPITIEQRIIGSLGTAWVGGGKVMVADVSGTRELPLPADLEVAAAEPPPADLLHTAYDLLHATGIDLGPYIRLFETFRDLIEGRSLPPGRPRPATFDDGVAAMAVLDAIRASARERRSVAVAADTP